jgi:uncharacterized protein YfaS (alpha-2-macroglobulin family)
MHHTGTSAKRVHRFLVLSLSFFILIALIPALAREVQAAAQIEHFSPQGTVKAIRQVTARFSEPMVSFGDPRLADPFDIRCAEKGQGRWVDARTWSYDFDRDLPGGLACRFTLKAGAKTLDGTPVAADTGFAFSTGGPSILRSNPYEGDTTIDEKQIFVLYLDAEPAQESLLKNVWFSVSGVGERVGVTMVSGKEREQVLKALRYRKDEGNVVTLRAKQAFPPSVKIRLVWGKGVAAMSGVATEEDQVLEFQARAPFRAEFSCPREKKGGACIPVLPMRLTFSAPTPWSLARDITLRSENGKTWKPKTTDDESRTHTQAITFTGPFPEKAAFSIEMPKGMKDDAGRPLANANRFPLAVKTESYPPLAKFAARFGILEAANPILPVTVRNIEAELKNHLLSVEGEAEEILPETPEPSAGGGRQDQAEAVAKAPAVSQQLRGKVRKVNLDREERVIHWLRNIAAATREKSVFAGQAGGKEFKLPAPEGGKAFEVIGIPLEKPGFYVVELESRILGTHLLGKPAPLYVPTTALVTNLAAHLKWGRESSLVWVTALDKAGPVSGADVTIRDCSGKRIWQGKTDERGVALIQGTLPSRDTQARCNWPVNYYEATGMLGGMSSGLFVFARSGDDATFTHSSWEDGIEPWRFQLPEADYRGLDDVAAHTILDRTLLRAGETVHMKHILRIPTTAGFTLPHDKARYDEVAIRHGGSGQEYRMPVSWNDNGSAATDWKIPEGARLGTYEVSLARKGDKKGAATLSTGSFQVEEFRIPLMTALVQGPAEAPVQPGEVGVDLSVSYFSGGGAGRLPVKLRGEIRPRTLTFRGYDEYTFTGERLKEGTRKFSPEDELGIDEEAMPGRGKPRRLPTQELRLDDAGAARTKFVKLPKIDTPKSLHAELEYRDPNGEVQTAAADIPLASSKRAVGLKPDSWAASAEALRYRVVVLDRAGNPVADSEVSVDLYQRKTYSHRRRIAGGFYSYENLTEIKRIALPCTAKSDDAGMAVCEAGPHCKGKTDASGTLLCEAPSPVSGGIILQAEVKDEDGNAALANFNLWVAGKDEWWFEARNDDRIDVIPEKKRYEPGEKARLQVRMPFREATALVTVEREGIVDVSIQKLSGKSPVVEIPVKRNYAPNAFVSVLAVRGRTADAAPTATFDPAKPAFKLGIGEIRVGWKAHELAVEVIPDRSVYRVRQEADVTFKVRRADGQKLPEGTELAVAAVDRGLLALRPNGSWRLLESMMRQRPYEIFTSTAQMMVIGKRHFGLKALPQGGGGGKQITRELFDTLLLWKAAIPLDDKGEARLKIPLKDSLTEYRIVAVATGGADLFGTGQADVRTTQDLMLLSGIAPLAREGDFMKAGVTLRNTTQKPMNVEAKLAVEAGQEKTDYETLRVGLSPGEAKEVGWDVRIPAGVEKLDYEISALERDGKTADRIRVSQKVVPAVPVRTWQATLVQVRDRVEFPVERPAGAIVGKGGIAVRLQPRIADGLAGVREYMSLYPYGCLEQKISKAVALKDKALWQERVRELPAYLDDEGLLKYFPRMQTGSDVLTAYVLAITHESGFEIPASTRDRMSAGLTGFVEGRVRRGSALATADLAIRKVAAVEALSRYGKAKAALLGSVAVEPALWPTSAVIDWIGVLKRTGDIPERTKKLAAAQQILRSRLNLQGTTMGFSTEQADGLWWLMVSPDVNAVRTLLAVVDLDAWKEDAPRIAKGAIGRMKQGHWDTTTANAWGTLAFEKFSMAFEKADVSGKTTAALGPKSSTVGWGLWETPKGGTVRFDWPDRRETLAIRHEGDGAPWATIQGLAAVPLRKPFSSGYRIKKTVTPVEKKVKTFWSRGDVVRVLLEVEAQSDMTWVVLSDPIPAGSAILTVGLEPGADKNAGRVAEAYTERAFEACRFYYSYVPKGTWKTGYTLRLNNEGTLQLPPTRAEALYAPEMFGEIPNASLSVNP